MVAYKTRFNGMPRDQLEEVADIALGASEALAESNKMLQSAVQRCAKLLAERKCHKPGIHLPGWHCPQCCAFNGAEKEILKACRACEEPIPLAIEEELRK